ncbi:hypothetical protein CTV96_09750 [Bacillus altitudinis]|uniref:hypothetical protein n=1 Tax=Bacillus TaxID=1386 RepID=UPI000C250192|nr:MULTISPECIES: hypothetical protein [Bacillus]MCM3140402.1 hypothetical protein [Bacillus safensis]PJI12420.1 hypothetical protein CTV96_09750 [Bacillus altitudinis]PKQ85565.1 hypothetical protein CTV98_007345 [Bacillus altitudinis]
MAVYKATPFYMIGSSQKIVFDHNGTYETDDLDEINLLDGLCPKWVTCIKTEDKTKPAPAKKPAKKSSAK